VIAVKIVSIWYLFILAGSYLTSDTGAYFNDVEKISGKISAASDFCKEAKKGSDYWQKNCKDNSGIGNGPEPSDPNTGDHTDPDNPGKNKNGCDDHTNAPCSEVRDLKENHTSNSISLSWSNPDSATNSNFSYVKIYRNNEKTPIADNIQNGQFVDNNLTPSTKYSYKITTIDKSGKESKGTSIGVTTSDAQSVKPNSSKVSTSTDNAKTDETLERDTNTN